MHHVLQETELPRQYPNEIPHNEKLLSLKYEVSAHLPRLGSAPWGAAGKVPGARTCGCPARGFQWGRSKIEGGK